MRNAALAALQICFALLCKGVYRLVKDLVDRLYSVLHLRTQVGELLVFLAGRKAASIFLPIFPFVLRSADDEFSKRSLGNRVRRVIRTHRCSLMLRVESLQGGSDRTRSAHDSNSVFVKRFI
jgi:hypothetical protein